LATEADVTCLVSIINEAFSVETFLEGTRTDRERLSAMMAAGEVLVAEDGAGKPLGCVYLEVRGVRGYLGMLAVGPSHQRTGMGRAIMLAAEQHLRNKGCQFVDICVLSKRTELPPIYRRFGYVETGVEQSHPMQPLKPGVSCHAILMSKAL
jgi:predicted N-acetyltransferase YhbS